MSAEDRRSGIDKLFDIAESALGPLEAALGPGPAPSVPSGSTPDPRVIGVEGPDPRVIDVEGAWAREYFWAVVVADNTWHALREGRMATECKPAQELRSGDLLERQKLEHGKRIVACTSCIIAIARKA